MLMLMRTELSQLVSIQGMKHECKIQRQHQSAASRRGVESVSLSFLKRHKAFWGC
jgi:hypothetical protein